MMTTMIVFVRLDDTMNGQVYAENQEQCCAYMPEPFLEGCHLTGEIADAYCAVTYQPRNQHDRYTGSQAKDNWHQPVPSTRQGKRDIDHRQEIH